ncbi:rho GTPase-activating protein 44-like isoform X2 [Bacillus rossius redtenbacheri]|uniref:rho GTPase-activating protein 44-like isoform X2 n=1 Tax=Bacillus rossius redtenbacheri TaxID=93214 RepID=UPI002FDEC7E7
MKKQFFRVKQLADQTFSRAGKTEVLSDDLQEADRKVEYIRAVCLNTSKKLASCLVGQGLGQDAVAKDKMLKKIPEYMLGVAMQESGSADEDCLLRNVLAECGKVETELANEVLSHDAKVEELVVNRLHSMLEPDVANILKHKRNLAKLILDMDSARTRHQTAVKHSGASTGTSRVESIKEELEDAELKVEQCRDQLASEMFQLLSREADFARVIVQHVKLQKAYHESALAVLETVIPQLEASINESSSKPVYGYPLESHLEVTGRKIAFPIELCVCALLELGMDEEGLFRVAGGASKLRRMKMSFDACCLNLPMALEYRDPHVIAGALKSYLRELPEPLMTHALYDEWMAAARVQGSNDARLQAFWQVVQKLPSANYDNLSYLVKFLAVLARNHEVNKMSPQNIAIVIAPNLIWSKEDEQNIGMNMNSANMYSFILDNLVSFADWFFPGEVEFYQTLSRETALVNGMTASYTSLSGQLPAETAGVAPSEKTTRHARSSSGEGQLLGSADEGVDMKRTQSNSSLSDHSSPPHGSPKPATRRKNKPAPVPPSNSVSARDPPVPFVTEKAAVEKPDKPPRPAVGPITVSTLPRPSKSKLLDGEARPADAQSQTIVVKPAMETTSSQAKAPSSSDAPQQQLVTISSSHQKLPEKVSIGSVVRVTDDAVTCVSIEAQHPPPPHITSAKTDHGVSRPGNYSSVTLDRKPGAQRPVPVAAPRSVVNVGPVPSAKEVYLHGDALSNPVKQSSEDEGVTLRRPSHADKPAVPERPATLLRPHSSFRSPRTSGEPDSSAAGDVGGEREKMPLVSDDVGGDEPVLVRSPSVGARPLSMTLPDKAITVEKPNRPPRPDNVFPAEKDKKQLPSHSRTRSEGNICDIDTKESTAVMKTATGSSHSPSSPKTTNKPPRPHPPPPPPPSKGRNHESVWESTDL